MLNKQILNINDIIRLYGDKKIFLITGKNTFDFLKKKNINSILDKLKNLTIFFKRKDVPDYNELKVIVKECKKKDPHIIIGLGGGTVIDYAKLTRFFLYEKKIKFDIRKSNKSKNFKKLICIPTTCGSGAESTTFSVLYKNNKKFSLNNKFMIPDFYCLIPNYIKNIKKRIATPPALDAFSQTIESIMSINSTKKSLNFSFKSLKILSKYLFKYIKKRDLSSTRKMVLAANYAGKAINISKTTGPHALSYIFTSKYKIPHGRAVFISLKLFLKINYNRMNEKKFLKKKFKKIFSILNIRSFVEFEKIMEKLSRSYHIDIKKIRKDIKKNPDLFVKSVNLERLKNNPIKIDNHTLKEIVNSI